MLEDLSVEQLMALTQHNSNKSEILQAYVNGETFIEKAEVQISFNNGEYGYILLDLSQLVTSAFLERAAKQQIENLKETNDSYKQIIKECIDNL